MNIEQWLSTELGQKIWTNKYRHESESLDDWFNRVSGNNEDVKKANEVEPLEQVIDSLNSSLKNHHIERLQSGKCTIELGFILSDVMTDFERISDHCSNIAVCVSQIHSGSFDTHEYLHALKKEEEFETEYKELKKQYQLPTLKA